MLFLICSIDWLLGASDRLILLEFTVFAQWLQVPSIYHCEFILSCFVFSGHIVFQIFFIWCQFVWIEVSALLASMYYHAPPQRRGFQWHCILSCSSSAQRLALALHIIMLLLSIGACFGIANYHAPPQRRGLLWHCILSCSSSAQRLGLALHNIICLLWNCVISCSSSAQRLALALHNIICLLWNCVISCSSSAQRLALALNNIICLLWNCIISCSSSVQRLFKLLLIII